MKQIKHKAFHDGEMRYNASRVRNALYWDDGKNFDLLAFKQKNPAVLLDYIGFEDANDTEIYEGDILGDDWNRRLLTEWHRGGFRFKAITETNFGYAPVGQWFEYTDLFPRPRIIGNAYTHPELLVLSKCCNATITIHDFSSQCDECGRSVNPDTGEPYPSQFRGLEAC